MFSELEKLPSELAIEAGYFALVGLERRLSPQEVLELPLSDLKGGRAIAGAWLAEIEDREGGQLSHLDEVVVTRYMGELSEKLRFKALADFKPNPARGRSLLAELRTIPLAS